MKLTRKQQNSAQIAQLFDDFAESLPSQTHLSEKASNAMPSARKKIKRRWVFALAACCVVVLIAVCVFYKSIEAPQNSTSNEQSPNSQVLPGSSGTQGSTSLSVEVFEPQDVDNVVLLAPASAEKYLPISVLKAQPQFNVVYERYYAYYFKQIGELAYIQAILGVETEYGVVEINLIADDENYVEESRLEAYNLTIKDNKQDVVFCDEEVNNGEYVTRAYFNANNFNFYIYAQSNPQNSANVEEIIKIFSLEWDKSAN